MKRYNICTKKLYKGKDGMEKAQWNNVGSLVYFPASNDKTEGYRLELSMFPDTPLYVFEQRPKEAPASTGSLPTIDIDEANAGPEDLPF